MRIEPVLSELIQPEATQEEVQQEPVAFKPAPVAKTTPRPVGGARPVRPRA